MQENLISPTIQLNNGLLMPRVGLGTHAIKDVSNTIYECIKSGIRHFDCAFRYGNEKEIGEAINKAIKDGIVRREELFVATKLWVTDRTDPEAAIRKQLSAFGLDYFDLYLEHMPLSILEENGNVVKTPLHQLWPKMEALVKKGLTKSIGVSNYHVQLLMELLSYCEIKPVCNQIEYHPYLTEVDLISYCKKVGVVVVAYNSLCRGTYMSFHTEKNKNLLEEPLVKKYAEKYSKTPGQVALNFALAQDVLVIPASSNATRMPENLGSLSFKLTEEELESLRDLNEGIRFNPTSQWEWSNGVNLFA